MVAGEPVTAMAAMAARLQERVFAWKQRLAQKYACCMHVVLREDGRVAVLCSLSISGLCCVGWIDPCRKARAVETLPLRLHHAITSPFSTADR